MHAIQRTAALTLLFTCLLPATITFAEEITNETTEAIEETLEQDSSSKVIVVSANRYPTSLKEIGSSVTVIDEEEIERKNQPTVLEVLRTVPGVAISQTGGPGRVASIFIRGAESDQTLVLIDGVRANDNNVGQFDFANLKAENIARIEVLKGAQSVLYGADAIGGVINIITKTAKDGLHASASAEGGSFGTQQYKGALSWGSESVHTSTTVSYLENDGISAAASSRGNSEDDSYENFSVSNRSGIRFLEDGTADFTINYSNAETELDGFDFTAGAVDDRNYRQKTDLLVASLVLSKSITDSITPSLELGFKDGDSEGIDPDTEFNNFIIKDQTQSLTTKVDFLMPWDGVLSVGYSFENRKGENEGNFDESRDVNSLFVQKQYSLNDALFLTGGVRYDDDSRFGEQVTFRTTAAYLLEESGTRIHASFGTGFKAPTFNELFFPNFGNQDLEAETSRGYDIGVEQTLIEDTVVLDTTFFYNKIDDLITFDSETFLAENIQEAKAFGVESELSLTLAENLETKFSYTYTDSENKSTGGILPRRPRHRGTMQLFAEPIEGLEASISLVLVNSRRDSDGSRLDNYEVVNTALSYTLCEHLKPFVRIDNLFDQNYEEVNGFGTPGFSVYAGIRGSL